MEFETAWQATKDYWRKHGYAHYGLPKPGMGLGKGLACEGWFDQAVAFLESTDAEMTKVV